MDASQITKLLQKQHTRIIRNNNPIDSSTMTWKNQLMHSKYIKGVKTCTGLIDTNNNTQCCNNEYGSNQLTLTTGSYLKGANGSAGRIYSSEAIVLQKAGQHACNDPNVVTILPSCYTSNTNGPSSSNVDPPVNNQSNPYLPPFDTYYQFKTKTGCCTYHGFKSNRGCCSSL
jgi:hypothetical protein